MTVLNLKRFNMAFCTLCFLLVSTFLNAQQSARMDEKTLAPLFAQRYAAYIEAIHTLDLPTLRKLALPDMRTEARGEVHKSVEEVSLLLADPEKNKEAIARRRRPNPSSLPPTYSVSSITVHGNDASSVVTVVSHLIQRGQVPQTTLTVQVHVDWKKAGGDWKISYVHIVDFAQEQAAPPHKDGPLPKWALAFNKAVGLIGKSKAQMVEALGPPVIGDDLNYHYVLDSQRHSGQFYDQSVGHMTTISRIQTTELDISLDAGRVIDVTLNFDTTDPDVAVFPTMAQVWSALDALTQKPATFQMNSGAVITYWMHQAHSVLPDPNVGTFGTFFHGTLAGNIPVEIVSASGVPQMKGTPTFNVDNNRYEITTFVPNPAFSWRSALVHRIQTRTHPDQFNYHHQGHGQGNEYPVSP